MLSAGLYNVNAYAYKTISIVCDSILPKMAECIIKQLSSFLFIDFFKLLCIYWLCVHIWS